MEIFGKLQNKMMELESETEHKGYYYKVSDALTIMICGMLCNLQNISDIHEWSQAESVRDFLFKELRIDKLPSRAQFYNLIGCVKSEQFQKVLMEWVEDVVQSGERIRTIAIDGKTICSTEKRKANDEESVHILSAVISESNLILGSMPCDKKISEPKVFRQLIEILNIKGAVVAADALHTTKKSAEKVVKEGGDYLFVVKDNNPELKRDRIVCSK